MDFRRMTQYIPKSENRMSWKYIVTFDKERNVENIYFFIFYFIYLFIGLSILLRKEDKQIILSKSGEIVKAKFV